METSEILEDKIQDLSNCSLFTTNFNIFNQIVDSKSENSLKDEKYESENQNRAHESNYINYFYSVDDILIEAIVQWFKIDNISFYNKIFSF